MSGVRVALAWWPLDPDQPLGDDRARELVAALRPIIVPVVDAAEADLRARIGPQGQCVRSGVPARYLAGATFATGMQSLCVGTVYQMRAGDPQQNSIQLMRDGELTWRRELRVDARR